MRLRQMIPSNYGIPHVNMNSLEGGYISSPQITQPHLVNMNSDAESVEGKAAQHAHGVDARSVHRSVSGTAKEVLTKK